MDKPGLLILVGLAVMLSLGIAVLCDLWLERMRGRELKRLEVQIDALALEVEAVALKTHPLPRRNRRI